MLNSNPTIYADLNAVLDELVTATQAILGDNFCGAYLQGSFAVGDADAYSDVDFMIVTHDEVRDDHVLALGALHARFPMFEVDWAKHLEGSYVPKARLRRPDPSRAPYLYVDNGSSTLEWSNHDNTAVVRWTLRECGIALDESWSTWLQPHIVLYYCRMLHTLNTGRVGSKLAAGHWALEALDSQWAPLIKRALDDRPDPWLRVHRPADQTAIADTREFIDYALQRAETASL